MGSPPLKPAGLPMEADQFTSNRDGRRRKREDLGLGSELPCTNKKRRAPGEHRTFKVNLAPDDTRRFTIPLYRSWDQFETLLRDEYPWAFDLPEEGDDVVMIRYEDESRDLCILSSQSEWEALCHNRLLGPIVRLRITHEKPRFPSVKPEPMHEDDKDANRFQPPPSLPFLDNDINSGASQEGRGSPAVKVEPMLHRLGDEVFAGLGPSEDALPSGPAADAYAVAMAATTTTTTTTTTSSTTTPFLRMDRTMVQIKIEKVDDDNPNNAMTMMYSDRDAEPQGTRQQEEDEEKEKKKVKEEKAEEEEEKEEEGMMGIISRWTPGWMRLFRKSSPLLIDPETFPPQAAPEGEEAQPEPEPEPEPELEGSQEQALDRDESVRRKRRRSSSDDRRRSSSDDRRRSSTDGTRRRLRRSFSSASAAAK